MRLPTEVSGSVRGPATRWEANLVDDRPPRLAQLLSSHPPVRERVLAALRHAERPVQPQQPVVKVALHSTSDASRCSALLVARILPIFSLLAP